MKMKGTHTFKAPATKVFQTILDPQKLQASIPGCDQVEYLDPTHIEVQVAPSLPGLKGHYHSVLRIVEREDPHRLVLSAQRRGKVGTLHAQAQITLEDTAAGTSLSYDAQADLTGAIAIANNPIGEGIVKNALSTFFKNIEKEITAS